VDVGGAQETLTLRSRTLGRVSGLGSGRVIRDTGTGADFELDIGNEKFALSTWWKEGPLAPDDGSV